LEKIKNNLKRLKKLNIFEIKDRQRRPFSYDIPLAHLPMHCYGLILANSFTDILPIDGNMVLSLFHTH
jgi:hypothetical protein